MGSRALLKFGIQTQRIPKEKYEILSKHIVEKLKTKFPDAVDILAYKNKKDFGDMDVLVLKGKDSDNVPEMLKELFDYSQIYVNTPVYSFEYNQFQIDAILTPNLNWQTSFTYYSYNDLGNFMGRIAHKFGAKYGHDGLTYKVRSIDNDKVLGEVILSKNPPEIFKFLGFDYKKWESGFDELEDIFHYVINSSYFNPSIFDYEALNHQNRTRNKKRDSYRKFLEFIASENLRPEDFFQYREKISYIQWIDDQFPDAHLLENIAKMKDRENELLFVRSKFNGDIIMRIKNIEGRELGGFIQKFKNSISEDPKKFEEWVKSKTKEEIEIAINEFS